jgi:hypothetical protein
MADINDLEMVLKAMWQEVKGGFGLYWASTAKMGQILCM